MKKILFVMGEYLNGSSQNGICVEAIKQELVKMKSEVHILCYEDNKHENNVYTVPKTEYQFMSLRYIINMFCHPPIVYVSTVNNYVKKIIQLHKKHHYDAVIAVVNPAESAEAVYKVKKKFPELKTMIYEIDPVSNKFLKSKNIAKIIYRKVVISWEEKVFSTVDKIVHMKTHIEHFSSGIYKPYDQKSVFLDIPNFCPTLDRNIIIFSDEKLSMVYAGAFYPGLRDPDYLINFLNCISEVKPIDCDIYTDNRMKNELVRLISDNNQHIHLHGMIPNEQVMGIMKHVDLLLSVGNKKSRFLPSKIFTYMSLGKPIVHILGDMNDTVIPYLKKYPAALLINPEDTVEDNTIKFFQFITECNGLVVNKDDLISCFYENTPVYTANTICKLLELD